MLASTEAPSRSFTKKIEPGVEDSQERYRLILPEIAGYYCGIFNVLRSSKAFQEVHGNVEELLTPRLTAINTKLENIRIPPNRDLHKDFAQAILNYDAGLSDAKLHREIRAANGKTYVLWLNYRQGKWQVEAEEK